MYLSNVSAQCCGGGAAARPDRALHVAADPLIRAADVERRLVGAVQRADRHHVARAPAGDVALGPGVDSPAADEDGVRGRRAARRRRRPSPRSARASSCAGGGQQGASRSGGTRVEMIPSRCGPGPADHPGLRVEVAVLPVLLPERVGVGEARPWRRARGAGGQASRRRSAETPSTGMSRSGPTGTAETTASDSNRSPVAVVDRAADRRTRIRFDRSRVADPVRQLLGHPQRDGRRALGDPLPPRSRTRRSRRRRPRPPCAARRAARCARPTRRRARARGRGRGRRLGSRRPSRSQSPTESRSSRSASGCDHGIVGVDRRRELARTPPRRCVARPVGVAHPGVAVADESPLGEHLGFLAGRGGEGGTRSARALRPARGRRRETGRSARRRAARGARRRASSARRARRGGRAPRARPRPRPGSQIAGGGEAREARSDDNDVVFHGGTLS